MHMPLQMFAANYTSFQSRASHCKRLTVVHYSQSAKTLTHLLPHREDFWGQCGRAGGLHHQLSWSIWRFGSHLYCTRCACSPVPPLSVSLIHHAPRIRHLVVLYCRGCFIVQQQGLVQYCCMHCCTAELPASGLLLSSAV